MAETCVFSKQTPDPFHCGPPRLLHPKGHPLSRSYGVNLPSSFTSVISSALESSSRLPVSVLVRAAWFNLPEAFLGDLSGDFGVVNALALAGPASSSRLALPYRVTRVVPRTGAGILTRRPSSTPFGLD